MDSKNSTFTGPIFFWEGVSMDSGTFTLTGPLFLGKEEI